jgi:aminoglycoside phosphotransferase (APT) family kinase protein
MRRGTWSWRLAISRLLDPGASGRIRAIVPVLAAGGIPVPALVDIGEPPGYVVSEFVDGAPGSTLLDEPRGPAVVGAALGGAWAALRGVDASAADLSDAWTDTPRLASSSRARVRRLSERLASEEIATLDGDIAELPGLLAGREPGVVHGDLAPVNVLIRDGAIAALLDVEFVRLAEPVLDAAWFHWIVTFHHPAEAGAAWGAFVAASGLDVADDPQVRGLLRILPRIRILEILDDDRLTEASADHWLGMLHASLSRPDA